MPGRSPDGPQSPAPPTPLSQPASPGSDAPVPRVTVLGIGQMGLVCAGILAGGRANGDNRPHPSPIRSAAAVTLWGHSEDEAGELTQMRTSARLPEFVLPASVRVTSDLIRSVEGADIIVCAIPVQFIRDVFKRLRGKLRPPPPPGTRPGPDGWGAGGGAAGLISVSKGIEVATLLRPTQIMTDCLRDDPDGRPRPVGILSGPTIAPELVRCLPATMIAASDAPGFAQQVQRLFSTHYLRIYTHEDVLGVELAGAMKNVIAIAAGVLDGLQAGYNAKSALLARGLAEITRLGVAMGASPDTFFGLSGVGDLATTCFSPEGRNRSCGEALGRGVKLDEYLKAIPYVVEGVATTRAVMELARKYRVEMPITAAVYSALYEGMDPIEGIGRLMSREMKAERVG